jgi:hypothetical protein
LSWVSLWLYLSSLLCFVWEALHVTTHTVLHTHAHIPANVVRKRKIKDRWNEMDKDRKRKMEIQRERSSTGHTCTPLHLVEFQILLRSHAFTESLSEKASEVFGMLAKNNNNNNAVV